MLNCCVNMTERCPARYFPEKHNRLDLAGAVENITFKSVVDGLGYLKSDVNRLRVTALMGKWVETGILKQLTGSLRADTYEWFRDVYTDMQEKLGFLGQQTYTNAGLTDKYYPMVRPMYAFDPHLKKSFMFCGTGEANQIIEVVDRIYRFKFLQLYRSLGLGSFPSQEFEEYWENVPDGLSRTESLQMRNDVAMRRYVLEAGLILFRQLVDPIKFPDKLVIPDVKMDGIQFDGVLLDRNKSFGASFWVRKNFPGPMGNTEYDVLEIKTKFSPRFTSGRDTLRRPLVSDVRQFKGRLGQLVVSRAEKGLDFKLPRSVYFLYPRSILPNRIHQLPIDTPFLEKWMDDLKERILESDEVEPRVPMLYQLLSSLN